jgi:hypothetical protein
VILAMAIAVVGVAVLISATSASDQDQRVHFTQLWMLPAAHNHAQIGITNLEGRTVSYRIRVAIGRRRLFSARMRLRSSGSWNTTMRLPRTTPRKLVTARLYRASSPAPYRVTNLWTPGG